MREGWCLFLGSYNRWVGVQKGPEGGGSELGGARTRPSLQAKALRSPARVLEEGDAGRGRKWERRQVVWGWVRMMPFVPRELRASAGF